MKATKLIVILAVLSCFEFGHSAAQEKKASLAPQKFANECAIFEAAILNSSAWQNGDCLTVEEVVLDNVVRAVDGTLKGIVIHRKSRIRSVFDFEKKRYANYGLYTVSFTDFDTLVDDEPLTREETTWQSGCVDFKRGEVWLNDNKAGYRNILLLGNESLETVNPELGFRDYRACWGLNGFDRRAFEIAKNGVEMEKRGYGCKSAKSQDGTLEIKIDAVCNLPDVAGPFMTYRFNLATSMPTYLSEQLLFKKSKKKIEPRVRKLDWTKLNNLYVPSRIIVSEPINFLVNQKRQIGPGSRELNLTWFSINDDHLKDSFFDGSHVKNFEQLVDIVNPPISKAKQQRDTLKN